MIHRRAPSLRFIAQLSAVVCLAALTSATVRAASEDAELKRLMEAAVRVLVQAKQDSIAAARESSAVFEAAHALEKAKRTSEALDYFQEGLRLSPWNLDEQLAHARLLIATNQKDEAIDIAKMVSKRAETDALANAALAILGKPAVTSPAEWDGDAREPWLCFVKIGPVEDVILLDSMDKMSRTLGIKAWLLDDTIGLPQADRSAFDHWVAKQVIPQIKWFSPPAKHLLRSLDAVTPEEVPPRKLISALSASLVSSGLDREASTLREAAANYQRHDQQWSASNLLKLITRILQPRKSLGPAIVVGITSADLFDGDNNYLFGLASTGRRFCLVSCARFQADYAHEPPDRSRLVVRLHKQLLSSIGFALDVPRPTDPTSARAYPASMAEHDAKSEYMSTACIAGFERALDRKLPPEARPPERR